jgi:hypothetical protein
VASDGLLCNRLSITYFTRFHIKSTSRWCCPRVQTVALCLHEIAITRPCPDCVTLSSRQMQSVCTQFPYQGSQRSDGVALASGWVQAVFPLRVCEGKLETSLTLTSIQSCCHDILMDATLNCSASRHFCASGRMTRPSGQKHGILLQVFKQDSVQISTSRSQIQCFYLDAHQCQEAEQFKVAFI